MQKVKSSFAFYDLFIVYTDVQKYLQFFLLTFKKLTHIGISHAKMKFTESYFQLYYHIIKKVA